MSYFKGLKLTRQGEQLLARVNGNIGETLTFTRGELGDGEISSEDEIYYITALKRKWGELAITEITRTGEDKTQVRIETQFTNAEWTEEKILREIAIYAKGRETSEILFGYSNAGVNFDKIPIPQDNPQAFLIGITFKISTATKVDATISFSGFVTIEKLGEELAKKEDKILVKNTAFNKNFGVLEGEILEGHRLAQALGLEFGGELNNNSLKQAGKAYYDALNKSVYKCLVDNTIDYADTSKFEAISNDDLLLKLQNLINNLGAKFLETTGTPPKTVEELNSIAGFIKANCLPPDEDFQRYNLYCITFKQGNVTGGHIIVRVSSCISFYLFEAFIQVSKYCIATSYGNAIPVFLEK